VLKITLLFLIVSCSAPELAPQADLAGAQPIASGPLFEDQDITLPSPAWTAAVPLTLVAPGGANLAILDHIGVRVEVIQIRSGRILVRCSGCTGSTMNAEGWLPRGVLWAALPSPTEADPTAKDPLSLSLSLRAQWAAGIGLPEGSTADAFCAAIDQGWRVDTNQAVVDHKGGQIKLVRTGSDWALVQQDVPPPPTAGSCD
jgi:hypothetical protein